MECFIGTLSLDFDHLMLCSSVRLKLDIEGLRQWGLFRSFPIYFFQLLKFFRWIYGDQAGWNGQVLNHWYHHQSYQIFVNVPLFMMFVDQLIFVQYSLHPFLPMNSDTYLSTFPFVSYHDTLLEKAQAQMIPSMYTRYVPAAVRRSIANT